MTFPLRKVIDAIAEQAARRSVEQINNFRAQQSQSVSQPTVGIVQQIKNNTEGQISGPVIVVLFPDGTTSECQVGNRWLTVGDTTVVFGGMAH